MRRVGSSVSVKISIKTTHKFDFYTFSTAVPAISCSTYFLSIITVCWLSESEYSFDGTAKTQCCEFNCYHIFWGYSQQTFSMQEWWFVGPTTQCTNKNITEICRARWKDEAKAGKGEEKMMISHEKIPKIYPLIHSFPYATVELLCCVVFQCDMPKRWIYFFVCSPTFSPFRFYSPLIHQIELRSAVDIVVYFALLLCSIPHVLTEKIPFHQAATAAQLQRSKKKWRRVLFSLGESMHTQHNPSEISERWGKFTDI